MKVGNIGLLVAVMTALSACGHRELKAPCSSSDVPRNVTQFFEGQTSHPTPFDALGLDERDCGPLRPLNREPAPAGE